jgi:hypothetical protein
MTNITMVEVFTEQVFDYIRNQYGKNILKNVQTDKNKSTISKIIQSSSNQSDSVEHTANKIIAMLRMNP